MNKTYNPMGKDTPYSIEMAVGSGYEGGNPRTSRLALMQNMAMVVMMSCSHNYDVSFFKKMCGCVTVTLNLILSFLERNFSISPSNWGSE